MQIIVYLQKQNITEKEIFLKLILKHFAEKIVAFKGKEIVRKIIKQEKYMKSDS
jgi:hypothetical protein